MKKDPKLNAQAATKLYNISHRTLLY